jgi:hypothetical protein
MRCSFLTLAMGLLGACLRPDGLALAADPALLASPTSEVVTHELAPAQLQEDFQRLRFTLEHAHAALYRYTPKVEMDARLDAVALRLNRPMTDLEFYRLLAPIIGAIRNSHTSIQPPADALRSIRAYDDAFPFVLRFRDQRAYVEVNLSADTSIRRGMEVLDLNGRPMAEVAQTLAEGRSAEGFVDATKYGRMNQSFWLDLLLHIGPSPSYTLVVRDPASGTTSRHQVAGVFAPTVAAHVEETPPPTGPAQSITIDRPDGVAVMRLRNFLEPRTDAFFREAFHDIAESRVGNLVIDLRGNHGGIDWFNSDLISYLSDRAFRFYRDRTLTAKSYVDLKYLTYSLDDFLFPDQIAALPAAVREHPFEHWTLPQLIDLSLATDHAGGVQTPKTEDHFSGRVYVLIDSASGSSSAEVPALLHHLGLATIIGEEPNGSYQGETAGIIPTLLLPNSKLAVRVPLLAYHNDVMPGVRIGRGVEPTFSVSETLEDSIAGVDTVMTFTRALIHARASANVQGSGVSTP